MIRISRDRDLPLHFEASALKAPVKVAGWLAGIVATAAGMAGFVHAGSMGAEAAAAALILAGGALVIGLIRCRHFEVTVGKKTIELRLGPFRRILPAGCVEEATPRPASSWRRFYARKELALTLSVELRDPIVPTHDPDELRTALVGDSKSDQ